MAQNKIAYGIFNQRNRIKNFEMYVRAKGSTLFYLERLRNSQHQDPVHVICGDTIEEILHSALAQGFDYCLVQSAGCQLRSYSFIDYLNDFISNNDFGVAGHPLLWPGRWLELHPQFFIVNLKYWQSAGCSEFGTWEEGPVELPVLERSEENFHDDYTPLWVRATGESALQTKAGQGWRLLKSMFDAGYPVLTLPENIRFNKFYTYPDNYTTRYLESIKTLTTYPEQNWNQAKWINDSIGVKDQIWLWNSEDMTIRNHSGPYDVACNTASGFKTFDLIKQGLLTDSARILVYDFNPKSIAWYKQLYTWVDDDLLSCIRSFADKDYFTWLGKHQAGYNEDSAFTHELHKVYAHFGGEQQFIETWRKFRSLPVTFHEVNIFAEPEKLAELFQGPGRKWINLTNIFSTDAGQLIFGHNECIVAQQRCLSLLYVIDPDINITMYDFWGRNVLGTVREIL